MIPGMMLEPAQRAGDAPRASEHAVSSEAAPVTRLAEPARFHAEREQWLMRRNLERQLHDGPALRLSALTLQLGLFWHRLTEAKPDLPASIDDLQDELHAVLQELRDVAGRIYPPLLDEAGLGPALREAADQLGVPVRVKAPADRFGPAAEGAAYFAVAGCLEAAAVESAESAAPQAISLDVVVRREDRILAVDIVGVDLHHADAMPALVRSLGGAIDVAGGAGVGTITVRLPCE
jgi:signal transduction histidine kinase